MKKLFLFFCFFSFSGCTSSGLNSSNTFFSQENVSEIIQKKEKDEHKKCISQKIRKIVSGTSMEPMIHNNDFIWLYPHYYETCHLEPKKGDLVAYNYGGSRVPLLKKVVATSQDMVQWKNGTLFINGKEEKNSANQSYTFSKAEKKIMFLSVKNNHIPQNSLLLLGDNIKNSQDSRKFGAIGVSDILGKFEIY